VVGILRLPAKYPNNFWNTSREIKNIASNNIINPILPGFSFTRLKLFANSEFLIKFFIFIKASLV
jgi:hypothetical protein